MQPNKINSARLISVSSRRARRIAFDDRATSVNEGNVRAQTAQPKRAMMHVVKKAGLADIPSFEFPFTPQQIQYTNLSPEITEIARPGKSPLVAFSRYRARQISFKFLIAVNLDGLVISVDQVIEQLQRLVNSSRVVYFTNFDKQITNSLSPDDETNRIFWSIIDFSLSSIRRNADNKIVAAEATLSLVENTNPQIKAADLPKITYTSATPQRNARTNKPAAADLTGSSWSNTEAATISLT